MNREKLRKEFREYLNQRTDEALKIVKMQLPDKSKDFNLQWNDKFSSGHDLYSRISRTNLTRKEAINTILRGIDAASQDLKSGDGVFVIDFKKSEFFLTVYMEKDKKTLVIKTILDYSMKLRATDRRLAVNEAEELFEMDLSEFYSDGFINGYYGSFLIEENVKRTELDVFLDIIIYVEL